MLSNNHAHSLWRLWTNNTFRCNVKHVGMLFSNKAKGGK